MKVLLLTSVDSSQGVVDALAYMLEKSGYEYSISTTVDSISGNTYELILSLNKNTFNQSVKLAKENNTLLIYLFTASTIEVDYPDDYSAASAFLLIKDTNLDVPDTLIPSFVKKIRLSHLITQAKGNEQRRKQPQKALVVLDSKLPNYLLLQKILPAINKYTHIEFTIADVPNTFANILNPHIKPALTDEDNFHDADFVIGNGMYIYKAITHQKPCIIAGDRGYGGILDAENFEIQWHHFFQGRAGGELDEHIPFEFILNDISFIHTSWFKLKDNHNELLSKFITAEDSNIEKFKTILEQTLHQHYNINHTLSKVYLEQTKAFNITFIDDEYFIEKAGSKELYSKIEKAEKDIINAFTYPCTYEEAYKKLNDSSYDKDEFIDFIKELIDEKVIQVCNI